MRVAAIGRGPARQAPHPHEPTAKVLIDDQAAAGQLGVAHVWVPPGGGVPEHAHGDSVALLAPLSGELLITCADRQENVASGVVVLLDRGERVRLTNETNETASALAVFAPAGSVRALSSWPAADRAAVTAPGLSVG